MGPPRAAPTRGRGFAGSGTSPPVVRGEAAEVLRRKLAAAGWSKRLAPEDVAGLKIVLPLAAYGAMFIAAAFDLLPVLVAAVIGLAISALAYVGLPAVIDMRMRGRRDKIVVGAADGARPAHPVNRGRDELRRGRQPARAPPRRPADRRARA